MWNWDSFSWSYFIFIPWILSILTSFYINLDHNNDIKFPMKLIWKLVYSGVGIEHCKFDYFIFFYLLFLDRPWWNLLMVDSIPPGQDWPCFSIIFLFFFISLFSWTLPSPFPGTFLFFLDSTLFPETFPFPSTLPFSLWTLPFSQDPSPLPRPFHFFPRTFLFFTGPVPFP